MFKSFGWLKKNSEAILGVDVIFLAENRKNVTHLHIKNEQSIKIWLHPLYRYMLALMALFVEDVFTS